MIIIEGTDAYESHFELCAVTCQGSLTESCIHNNNNEYCITVKFQVSIGVFLMVL